MQNVSVDACADLVIEGGLANRAQYGDGGEGISVPSSNVM